MSKRIASGSTPVITLEKTADTALHTQIYEGLRLSIVEGRLSSGQRIPSTRLLAKELGVSRLPVLNAYAQLLAEGYVETKIGSGTVVSSISPDRFTSTGKASRTARQGGGGKREVASRKDILMGRQRATWIRNPGAFNVGQVAYDLFPLRTWSSIISRRAKSMTLRSFSYGEALGSMNLRESIASHLRTSRSVRCEADQVLITSGSQQAIDLAAQVLVNPGDSVWVEEPGYAYSRDIFALLGARMVPVPVDEHGLDVQAGIEQCRGARVAMVTPSHQFPLGSTMSAQRRLQLLRWAQANGSWIIEDDYDSEIRFESSPVASLQGLDSDHRVVYVGTFSKILFPSLRLGYLVLPRDLLDYFRVIRRTRDLGPPSFMQEVLAEFMVEGHFDRHIRRMRLLYQDRRDVLLKCLDREFGTSAQICGAPAGMHLTLRFPGLRSDKEVATEACAKNLWLWPLSETYASHPPEQGFVLGFGGVSASSIPDGVARLASLESLRKQLRVVGS